MADGHIMISYQWDSQALVLKIKERLEADGFNIWMDLDQMSGNIFKKMAEAVEGASVMVCCMSEKYQKSINCNRELEYTQVCNKPIVPIKLQPLPYKPTGVLGLITAGMLYVEFVDDAKFENCIIALENEIRDHLGDGAAPPPPQPHVHKPPAPPTSQEHTMELKFIEKRSGSWNGAANDLIKELTTRGVKKGQVVSIDAHSNGNGAQAIVSAFYDTAAPAAGDLNLAYEVLNSNFAWDTFYSRMTAQVDGLKSEDIISITGSCNTDSNSVFYAFIDFPSYNTPGADELTYVEQRSGGWTSCADGLIHQLGERGVQNGQVVSISAHNNGADCDAIMVAFYDTMLPGRGPLQMSYKHFNAGWKWEKFYIEIAKECNTMKREQLVALTGSINTSDKSVFFLFRYL